MTGDLGAAYLGLQVLEREKQIYLELPGVQPDLEKSQYLIERQLKPEAQKEAIEYFEKNNIIPTSMIDVSDGLASDLKHICTPVSYTHLDVYKRQDTCIAYILYFY